MNLVDLSRTLQQDAVAIVFLNVLLQQFGLPVPVVPTLLLAGSLAATPGKVGKILAAAVLASVIVDWLWYHVGRRFGYRVLSGLCRLSINPASCVSQTEARFVRWGMMSLLVAKFIPGFSLVAAPIAGATRMHQVGFLLAAGTGCALWAGLALGSGWVLKDTVQAVIVALDRHMATALLLVLLLAGTWLGWKLWQKYRFGKLCAVPRITPQELIAAIDTEQPPLILDLRSPTMVAQTGLIPGTKLVTRDQLAQAVADWPRERPIVTLCGCPEDASAVLAASHLLKKGYVSVKPLQGGYEAWLEAHRTLPKNGTIASASAP
jgi:membrane protein DedA with SNARE-associated domain/rhodanese-related sulfurtransferase